MRSTGKRVAEANMTLCQGRAGIGFSELTICHCDILRASVTTIFYGTFRTSQQQISYDKTKFTLWIAPEKCHTYPKNVTFNPKNVTVPTSYLCHCLACSLRVCTRAGARARVRKKIKKRNTRKRARKRDPKASANCHAKSINSSRFALTEKAQKTAFFGQFSELTRKGYRVRASRSQKKQRRLAKGWKLEIIFLVQFPDENQA
jgi:hypothetical protein